MEALDHSFTQRAVVNADVQQLSFSSLHVRMHAPLSCDTVRAPAACPLVSCSCCSRSLGSCGRCGLRVTPVSVTMSPLSGPSWTSGAPSSLGPLAQGPPAVSPDEEEPTTLTAGHNSHVLRVALHMEVLHIRSLASSTTCP